MKTKKIQVIAEQIDTLVTLFHGLRSKPTDDHLSNDQFIRYTMEDLSEAELRKADEHLRSCLECTAKMEHLLEESTAWSGTHENKRLDALEKRCVFPQDIHEENETSPVPPGLKALLGGFMEKECSYTSLVHAVIQNHYLAEMGIPDEFIVLVAQVLQSHSDQAILEEVTVAEKEEQVLLGAQLAESLRIESPKEVFTRFSESFKCAKWEISPEEAGFVATNAECRFRDVFRKLGAVSPCEICCLNLMEGVAKAVKPGSEFSVEATLWRETKCRVKVA
ncbi:hypothetical protein ACFL6S_14220 [Candidatus Poribacteria bacterium]